MPILVHVARTIARADRDVLYVGAVASLAFAIGAALLLHYGSFARMLAAGDLSRAG